MKFEEWFSKKLVVGRYPTPQEIEKSKFDFIINVSDEYIPACHASSTITNKKYLWFPLNECKADMGLNSIYGAMLIMYMAEMEGKEVYLHCHAGANRSQTVADAYYFMRSKKHRERNTARVDAKANAVLFGLETESAYKNHNNRLLENIDCGLLPARRKTEAFLIKCEDAFKKAFESDYSSGGMLDWCKVKANF